MYRPQKMTFKFNSSNNTQRFSKCNCRECAADYCNIPLSVLYEIEQAQSSIQRSSDFPRHWKCRRMTWLSKVRHCRVRFRVQTLFGFCATTGDKDNLSVSRCDGELCKISPRWQTAGVKTFEVIKKKVPQNTIKLEKAAQSFKRFHGEILIYDFWI